MAKEIKPLNEKQRNAIDIYFVNGLNMTQAMISAGWSESTAKRQVTSFKKNPAVQAYMEEKRALISSERIAKQEEIMERLTTIIRREQKDQTVLQDGTIVQTQVSTADQLKALQMAMKYYGMDKAEIKSQVNIKTIVYGEDQNKEKEDAIDGDYIEL